MQDAESDLHLALQVVNGSGGNRSSSNITLELVEESIGTLFSGTLDSYLEKPIAQTDSTTKLYFVEIPASDYNAATDAWGAMQYSLNSQNN